MKLQTNHNNSVSKLEAVVADLKKAENMHIRNYRTTKLLLNAYTEKLEALKKARHKIIEKILKRRVVLDYEILKVEYKDLKTIAYYRFQNETKIRSTYAVCSSTDPFDYKKGLEVCEFRIGRDYFTRQLKQA